MKGFSLKQMSRRIAIVLTLAMILTSSVCTLSVSAASKPDLKKTNVKWDLKNNKTLKYKSKWYALGVKEHTVKMTKFKIKDAKKEGYKECTFTVTFNRNIKPTKNQIKKMATKIEKTGSFGGQFFVTVVDYKTGKCLEEKNDKNVTVTTSDWKYSKYQKKTAKGGYWIRYSRKNSINVKIVYPADYKNLAVGVGGMISVNQPKSLKKFWKGSGVFSKQTSIWNKKYGKYVHFMRVK